MTIIETSGRYIYAADTGDWRLLIAENRFEILPQVGAWEYSSGINLDNLATLIVEAKAHAIANGIIWSGI